MISVDLHLKGCTATVEAYPTDGISGGFAIIKVEGPGQYVSIFGKPEHAERFEQIAALLNECFVKPAAPTCTTAVETPADLAGDYLGPL